MNGQSNTEPGQEIAQSSDRINDVVALNQLVGVIVDYYSFKNRLKEDEEGDGWKPQNDSEEFVVPSKLDSIIEDAFTNQLKKFTT